MYPGDESSGGSAQDMSEQGSTGDRRRVDQPERVAGGVGRLHEDLRRRNYFFFFGLPWPVAGAPVAPGLAHLLPEIAHGDAKMPVDENMARGSTMLPKHPAVGLS